MGQNSPVEVFIVDLPDDVTKPGEGPLCGTETRAPYPPQGPDFAKLESDTTLWLIVAGAGWFTGTMWITGPLAWYMGTSGSGKARK